jgi:hypothetical protein
MKFPAHGSDTDTPCIEESDSHRKNSRCIRFEEERRDGCLGIFLPITLEIPTKDTNPCRNVLEAERKLLAHAEDWLIGGECELPLWRRRHSIEENFVFDGICHAGCIHDREFEPSLPLSRQCAEIHRPRFARLEGRMERIIPIIIGIPITACIHCRIDIDGIGNNVPQ